MLDDRVAERQLDETEGNSRAKRRRRLCGVHPDAAWVISEGDTVDEATVNIREAVELYLEPVEDDLVGAEGTAIQELIV